MTSLFIGNLARGIDERDLEDEFQKVASCTFRFKVTELMVKNIIRVLTLSASTRTRRMLSKLSRTSTIRTSMASASQFNSARRVASMMPPPTDALPAETTIVVAALPAEMMAHPRPATTATSPAISPESAVSPVATADQEADPTSKIHNQFKPIAGEEVDTVVAVAAVTSAAEVEEEAATTVTAAPDTAAAAPEDLAHLLDVMIAEDQEVMAATTEHEAANNLQLTSS